MAEVGYMCSELKVHVQDRRELFKHVRHVVEVFWRDIFGVVVSTSFIAPVMSPAQSDLVEKLGDVLEKEFKINLSVLALGTHKSPEHGFYVDHITKKLYCPPGYHLSLEDFWRAVFLQLQQHAEQVA